MPKVSDLLEQLNTLVRGSGCRVRKAKLEDEWWNYDAGILLVFKKDQTPIVLINKRKHLDYKGIYMDPSNGNIKKFDETINNELEDHAYVTVSFTAKKVNHLVFSN